MSESKREKKARILPFNTKEFDSDQDVSEVTRTLFTDAWAAYLDQTSMAALKLDEASIPIEEEVIEDRPKLTLI
jgi:DNA-binding transcriptional regulator GbsR (MarR family)